MSIRASHIGRAEAALYQAKRFYEAAGHAGVDGRGSAWSTGVDLDARIMAVSTARMYAELAVHEAAHAKPPRWVGPTVLQVEVSTMADNCTRLTEQLAHDIMRGALRPR